MAGGKLDAWLEESLLHEGQLKETRKRIVNCTSAKSI
jgi:hypothetical protein